MECIKREPDPPYDLQLMQQAKGDVLEVGWLAPYDNGLAVTQFTIYTNATADARVQDSGPFRTEGSSAAVSAADSYFSQLTPNTPYLFEVTASNSAGESLRYPGIPSEDPRSFGDKPYYLIKAGGYCKNRACGPGRTSTRAPAPRRSARTMWRPSTNAPRSSPPVRTAGSVSPTRVRRRGVGASARRRRSSMAPGTTAAAS